MEDEPTISPPTPSPPTELEKTEAEDTTPQDAPAEPADDPNEEGSGADPEAPTDDETTAPAEGDVQAAASHDLPRTTTTGDDDQDLRSAGDGAVSGAPGDDLDDPAQRHD